MFDVLILMYFVTAVLNSAVLHSWEVHEKNELSERFETVMLCVDRLRW